MAKFTIDDNEYDSDNLTDVQKRVVALYQQALKEEGESIAALELKELRESNLERNLKKWL